MAVGQQSDLRFGEQFYFTHEAIATSIFAVAAGARPVAITADPERVCVLQSFNRRVERIGHVGVNARNAVAVRTRTHAARNRLVISERPAGSWIDAADRQVAHAS